MGDLFDELKVNLKMIDKDLFVKLRDGILTFDQVRARLQQKNYNIHYKVIDDLKHDLYDPTIMDADPKNEQQILNKYGAKSLQDLRIDKIDHDLPVFDDRCVRSLYNNVPIMLAKDRKMRQKIKQNETKKEAILKSSEK